jgi:hypothetical protein
MFFYVLLEAIAGIVIGILLAVRTKKSEDVTYGKLDKVGIATNIMLIPAYLLMSPACLFIGMISEPYGEGILWIFGLLVSLIVASAPLICCLGLGFSVALRRKGKSKLSFAVQFAGFAGIVLMVLLYGVFAGTLISPLN